MTDMKRLFPLIATALVIPAAGVHVAAREKPDTSITEVRVPIISFAFKP